ncbi:hypothetical protein KSP39_PZI014117 [Platanthera zijinensis]|uniref:Uncharacterized protein n=1 Tax=Platanthera zijinensis TaxID=2320716 RepID=A0AAP0G3W2_9ASPA
MTIQDDMIRIPDTMGMPWECEKSIGDLIDVTFPGLGMHVGGKDYIRDRALLTPLNEHVNILNNTTLLQFPGEEVVYYSYDSVVDDRRDLYKPEFLNSLTPALSASIDKNCNITATTDNDYEYCDEVCREGTARWSNGLHSRVEGFRLIIPAVPSGLDAGEE